MQTPRSEGPITTPVTRAAPQPGAAGEQAIGLTVHALEVPDVADANLAARSRTTGGRIRMLLVLLVCAAPVIASYLTYFVIRPQGRTNYGDLVLPTRAMTDALALRTLDGKPVSARSLHGQWLLVAVGPAACDAACDKRLFMQRQLREMLGRERDRIEKVWLVTDDAPLAPALAQAIGAPVPVTALRANAAAVGRWLAAEPGRALQEHLYLVDPMGEWMMRMPADPDPARVKRDLDRVLRASASWDNAGRDHLGRDGEDQSSTNNSRTNNSSTNNIGTNNGSANNSSTNNGGTNNGSAGR